MYSRGKVATRIGAALAIGAGVMALSSGLGGCSPAGDYPRVLDDPTPRVDAPLSPDQVRQETNALISDRTQLNTDAQNATQSEPPPLQPNVPPNGAAAPSASAQNAGANGRP